MASRTAVCVRRATDAREQQVRDVRAGDQQHESAHGQQHLQAAAVLLLHHADAGAGRDDRDHLLRQQADRRPASSSPDSPSRAASTGAGRREPRRRCRRSVAPGLQAADDAQPRGDRLAQQRVGAGDQRLLLKRDPEVGRIVAERIAEEARAARRRRP